MDNTKPSILIPQQTTVQLFVPRYKLQKDKNTQLNDYVIYVYNKFINK